MLKITKLLAILFFVHVAVFPGIINAQIIFTEIMYDPDGADTGREWVEIYNNGSDPVDVTTYKLFENNVNHRISEFSGSKILNSGQYAVVADNPSKFIIDFPIGETTQIFDSAFSLNNTGEELILFDSDGTQIDRINYSVEMGGNDTGNSLQLNDSILIPAEPTPNGPNSTEPVDESPPAEDENGNNDSDNSSSGSENSNNDNSTGNSSNNSNSSSGSGSTHSNQVSVSTFKPKINFQSDIGRDRYVLINTPIKFELKHNQEKSAGIGALWNFGDGNSVKGRSVEHIFDREGEYNLVVNSSMKKEYSVDRAKIYVTKPNISIERQMNGDVIDLVLTNLSDKEVNIGGFYLKQKGMDKFVFSIDTIISGKQKLILSQKITSLNYSGEISIFYPNQDVYMSI